MDHFDDFVAWCHNAAVETQNPVYCWMAISTLWSKALIAEKKDQGDKVGLVLPYWCAEYIGSSASLISSLAEGADFRAPSEGDPVAFGLDVKPTIVSWKDSTNLIPEALGLKNSAWHPSAFRAYHKDKKSVQAHSEWQRQKGNGITHDERLAAVSTGLGDRKEKSVIRKRVAAGIKLFQKTAANDDQAPPAQTP